MGIITVYIIFYCNNMNINAEESECLNEELTKHRTELPKLRTKQKAYKHRTHYQTVFSKILKSRCP